MVLKKICSCGKYITQKERRCSNCSLKYKEKKKEFNKIYNSKNRDEDIDAFYKSSDWVITRDYILKKYHNYDLWEYFINNDDTKVANTVHHIEEIKDNYDLRLEEYNLFPVTAKSHMKIHKLYRKDKEGTQEKLKEIIKLARKEFLIY
mgnify:FL=1